MLILYGDAMSFWIHKKDKTGKTMLWQIDVAIPFVTTIVLALLAAFVGPNLYRNPSIILWIPFIILACGCALLFISKLSLYRKGIYGSLGPGLMTKRYATLYKAAYVLIGLGVLLLLATWNALRRA
jgi:hypothetical protein